MQYNFIRTKTRKIFQSHPFTLIAFFFLIEFGVSLRNVLKEEYRVLLFRHYIISVFCFFSGEKESKFFTHSDSVTTIKIMDKIRKQIKMVVEADTK